MKLTKTDFNQQSLVLFPRTKCIIREGMEAILNDSRLPSELRDDALLLKSHIENPDSEDRPAMFTKTHGSMMNCPECVGTGKYKELPENNNDEIDYKPCKTCKGEGQLYYEIIRKYYVPTEYHRKKVTK